MGIKHLLRSFCAEEVNATREGHARRGLLASCTWAPHLLGFSHFSTPAPHQQCPVKQAAVARVSYIENATPICALLHSLREYRSLGVSRDLWICPWQRFQSTPHLSMTAWVRVLSLQSLPASSILSYFTTQSCRCEAFSLSTYTAMLHASETHPNSLLCWRPPGLPANQSCCCSCHLTTSP